MKWEQGQYRGAVRSGNVHGCVEGVATTEPSQPNILTYEVTTEPSQLNTLTYEVLCDLFDDHNITNMDAEALGIVGMEFILKVFEFSNGTFLDHLSMEFVQTTDVWNCNGITFAERINYRYFILALLQCKAKMKILNLFTAIR